MTSVTLPRSVEEQTLLWTPTETAHSEQRTWPPGPAPSGLRDSGSGEDWGARGHEGALQNRISVGLLSEVPPAQTVRFQVVTDGRSFVVREAPAAEDLRGGLHRPRFHLVQSFPNRREAEAYRQYVSTLREASPGP